MYVGEAWQDIMIACNGDSTVECFHKPPKNETGKNSGCGTDFAYPYFISFVVLCSFLVSFSNLKLRY